LGNNIENLTLTGTSAINGTSAILWIIYLTGKQRSQYTYRQRKCNDTLDGGAGADKLTGGTGNDTYIVDNTGDVVTENAKRRN